MADLLAVPHPGLRVDRLTDGTQQSQGLHLVLARILIAPLDKRADRRGSRIENRDLVLVDDLPEAVWLRPIGSTLVHQHGCAIL